MSIYASAVEKHLELLRRICGYFHHTFGPLLVAYNGLLVENLRGLAHLPTLGKPLLQGFKEI